MSSTFSFVLLCFQACLIQSVFSVCLRNPAPGFAPAAYSLESAALGLGSCGCGAGLGLGPYGSSSLYAAEANVAAAGGLGAGGFPSPAGAFGGLGQGNMAVFGELPVAGGAALSGAVPVLGAVTFDGLLPAYGTVSVSGRSGCDCGCDYGIIY